MAAVNVPIDLKPAQAQAANASAPGLVAAASSHVTTIPVATAAAADAARSVWAPLATTASDDETTGHALAVGEQRRIAAIYRRQSDAVTTMVAIDDDNRQSLTLLPTGAVSI
jgi:hypothetical protein